MRFISIAIFLFCIQISVAFINATGILETNLQPQESWFDEVSQQEIKAQEYSDSQVTSATESFGFGDFVKGIFYFIKTFALGIISVRYTLNQFGILYTSQFNLIFSLAVYLLYFAGMAQFISNRATKTMR